MNKNFHYCILVFNIFFAIVSSAQEKSIEQIMREEQEALKQIQQETLDYQEQVAEDMRLYQEQISREYEAYEAEQRRQLAEMEREILRKWEETCEIFGEGDDGAQSCGNTGNGV